jgi:hypothetical protein
MWELHCNSNWIDKIVELNSYTLWWLACIASTTTLESLSNTIFDHPVDMASWIVSKIAMASPSAMASLCIHIFIPATTKIPSELKIHQPQPVWPKAR